MKFITIFDPKTQLNYAKYFKIAGAFAFLLSLTSILGFFIFGINWGIDFSGGLELQVKFPKEIPPAQIREVLNSIGFEKNQVQQFGSSESHEMLIRVEKASLLQEKDITNIKTLINQIDKASNIVFDEKSGSQVSIWLTEPKIADPNDHFAVKKALEDQRKALLNLLNQKSGLELRKTKIANQEANINDAVTADQPKDNMVRYTVQFAGLSNKIQKALEEKFGEVEIRRVDFVDSHVARQLRTDGLLALVYALIAIIIYIAIRFDMYYSPGAVVALIHDALVAALVFVVGRLEFDTPSIAALLTIIGYSINNTVVIFDRIRETVPQNHKKSLSIEELKPYINKAINDTMSRNINSTLTTLFASVAICIFATGVIQRFAIVLTVGITFGAFTSVFIAPGLYLFAKKYFEPKVADPKLSRSGPTREERAKGIV